MPPAGGPTEPGNRSADLTDTKIVTGCTDIHACHPSTEEVEAGAPGVQSHPQLYSEFKTCVEREGGEMAQLVKHENLSLILRIHVFCFFFKWCGMGW